MLGIFVIKGNRAEVVTPWGNGCLAQAQLKALGLNLIPYKVK